MLITAESRSLRQHLAVPIIDLIEAMSEIGISRTDAFECIDWMLDLIHPIEPYGNMNRYIIKKRKPEE